MGKNVKQPKRRETERQPDSRTRYFLYNSGNALAQIKVYGLRMIGMPKYESFAKLYLETFAEINHRITSGSLEGLL